MNKFQLLHCSIADDLRETFTAAGWQETGGNDWTVTWHSVEPTPFEFEQLGVTQRVSRLPGTKAICYKDELARNLRLMRENHGSSAGSNPYDFWPRTYVFPEDYQIFHERLKLEPDTHWLRKPADRSQGRGIEWAGLGNMSSEAGWVAQEYISRPCLADGRKFILRFYLLVNDVASMDLWASRRPQVKLCRTPYSKPGPDADLDAHLTNYQFQGAVGEDDAAEVSWRWEKLVEHLGRSEDEMESILTRCQSILYRMVTAGRHAMLRRHTPGAEKGFELFGIDIALDSDLKPWLLECNYSPALFWTPQTGETRIFIERILADCLSIVTHSEPPNGIMIPVRDSLPASGALRPNNNVTWRDLGGDFSLHSASTGRMYALNPTSALLWNGLEEEFPPFEIATEISRVANVCVEKVRADFERQLVDWYLEGLISSDEVTPDHSLHFFMLGRSFELKGYPELLEMLRDPFPNNVTRLPVTHEVLHVRKCEEYVLLQHASSRLRCLEESRLLSLLRAHLMLWAIDKHEIDGMGAMHAASFQAEGGLLLLGGPSGSGKSTLSTALKSNGHICYGDDLCLLQSDLLLLPVPTPVALRQGGKEALHDESGALEDGLAGKCLEGRPLTFLRCESSDPQPLHALVLVTYNPAGDSLTKLRIGSALKHVLKDVMQSDWLKNSDIDRLIKLLDNRIYQMTFSSPTSGIRMLKAGNLISVPNSGGPCETSALPCPPSPFL